jgi:hypothetical protein
VLTGQMKTTHAAESGHWYDRAGLPMYELEGKTGRRPTTLRDARKLGLVPSVTTVIRSASAPALELWKAKQVMLAAMTLPRLPNESDESFCERVMRDSKEEGRRAADRGTAIHAAIQGHFENQPPHPDYWPHVQGVKELLAQNCPPQDWRCEQSFCHPMGYGGKCDLHSQEWVLDFKTKEFTKEEAATLKGWDEHAMQLAAYRRGLETDREARCGIVYVSASVPGVVRLVEFDEQEIRRGWTMFTALLEYWKAKSGYYPEAWKEAA